jgi:hypothetical protein
MSFVLSGVAIPEDKAGTIQSLDTAISAAIISRGSVDTQTALGLTARDMTRKHMVAAMEELGIVPSLVEVAQATHGRGLFAREPIKCGSLITLYPGDACYASSRGPGGTLVALSALLKELLVEGSKDDARRISSWIKEHQEYMFSFPDGRYIIGAPEIDNDPLFLGHFANDANTCREETRHIYDRITPILTNATIYSFGRGSDDRLYCAGLVATKDIAADEEILIPYGSMYWIAYAAAHSTSV